MRADLVLLDAEHTDARADASSSVVIGSGLVLHDERA